MDRCGQNVVDAYRSYAAANEELVEWTLRFEHQWLKAEAKIEFLGNISDALLEQKLQTHFSKIIGVLQSKLSVTLIKLESLVETETPRKNDYNIWAKLGFKSKNRTSPGKEMKKAKYVAFVKRSLQIDFVELEKWQAMLEPSWFLLARSTNPEIARQLEQQAGETIDNRAITTMRNLRHVLRSESDNDRQNRKSIFLSQNFLATTDDRLDIPHSSSVQLAYTSSENRSVVVNTVRQNPQADKHTFANDIRELARVLSQADPMTFGILRCEGVVRRDDCFEFVFELPQTLRQPRSLRSVLLESDSCIYSLNDRIELGKLLARSVMFVHNSKFCHKNISPETILILKVDDKEGRSQREIPFLVGFEKFRPADGHTYLSGDDDWQKNLYRHPTRQGLSPEEMYQMQHDIYSLGVCLLEIGLWGTFVEFRTAPDNAEAEPVPAKGYIQAISEFLPMRNGRRRAIQIKEMLLEIAREHLPARIGVKFMEVVVSCLTCLDKGNKDFGDESEFLDTDGILVGVRYAEKV
jgi:hypothetical protein